MSLKEFDNKTIEEAQRQYAQEVRDRWGNTDAYVESQRKTAGYTKADWDRVQKEMETLFRSFAANMDQPPDSPAVQETVAAYQSYLSRNFYECGDQMLMALGEMYLADPRFQKTSTNTAKGWRAL